MSALKPGSSTMNYSLQDLLQPTVNMVYSLVDATIQSGQLPLCGPL